MNRLWLRIGMAMGVVVIFVALFPMVMRMFNPPEPPLPPLSTAGFPPELGAKVHEQMVLRETRLWMNLIRTLLAGGVIGLFAVVLLSRWLAAPLRNLEQAAKAFAEGQWGWRIPIGGSREMRSVSLAFNQMAEKLQKAEELRSNLLADVTHELRHPVHILQGNLQAVLDGIYPLDLGEIANLYEQTRHLSILLNDLHELAQAEAHQLPLHKQETDLTSLVQRTVEAFQPMASGQGIALSVHLPEESLTRCVDADRIRQAVQNLLGNALLHTPPGGSVQVTLREDSNRVEIIVADTGAGISSGNLPHIFDRFYSADPSRNRSHSGSGLGLAITQAIVKAHGGEIQAFSPGVGQGSVFTIYLYGVESGKI